MTGKRHRVGRAAMLVVAAVLTLLPASALAFEPNAGSMFGAPGASNEDKESAKLAKESAKLLVQEGGEAPGKNKEEPAGNSGEEPGKNKEGPAGNSGEEPGKNKEGPAGNSGEEPGKNKEERSGSEPGAVIPDPVEPDPQTPPPPSLEPVGPGGTTGVGSGPPPPLVPSAPEPATGGGPVTIDPASLPAHVGAAMVMFDGGDVAVTIDPTAPVTPSSGPVSDRVVRVLSPALPPPLTDAIAAPFIMAEALIDAMASSGQALVLPVLAAAAAILAPRRRDVYADVLEPE